MHWMGPIVTFNDAWLVIDPVTEIDQHSRGTVA